MYCRDCPYIKNEFLKKSKHITDIYDLIECEQSCYCDKTGGKLYMYGRCEDSDDYHLLYDNEIIKHKRRNNKQERNFKYKRKLEKMHKHISKYPCPVEYKNADWDFTGQRWIENKDSFYRRLNYGGKRKKYYKKISNKIIRRYKGSFHKCGKGFYKIFDYHWAIT